MENVKRRFAVVNLTTDQIVRRESADAAKACLQGMQEHGHLGLAIDGMAGEVVAASRIPFHLDVERLVLRVGGVGLSVDTLRLLDKVAAPALLLVDRDDDGVLAVRTADELAGITADVETISVDGHRIARQALAALVDSAAADPGVVGGMMRAYVEGGVFKLFLIPEPRPDEKPATGGGDAQGGIAVPPKGDPDTLETVFTPDAQSVAMREALDAMPLANPLPQSEPAAAAAAAPVAPAPKSRRPSTRARGAAKSQG